jgi:endoglucanase
MRRIIGIGLLVIAVGIAAGVTFVNSGKGEEPLVFSQRGMLAELWRQYKQEYLEPGTGRTLDKQRDNITTSEGEAYTMLRAAWLSDQVIFDQSWQWTKDNLQHGENDKLFAWLFGKAPDGTYQVLSDQGGNNTASDGDTDIALALVFAAHRWSDDKYLADAKPIIKDIWEKEVVDIGGQPVLAANNLEKSADAPDVLVNPSYFAPYAYRIFAQVDPDHDWNRLADSSYVWLERSQTASFGGKREGGLPPDWMLVNRDSGAISAPTQAGLTNAFSYDAMRTPWRIALDWQWNKPPQAKQALERMTALKDSWEQDGRIVTTYKPDGTPSSGQQSPAGYGATLGYFIVTDSGAADTIYNDKLKTLYDPDKPGWTENLGYYDSNWAWFGLALHDNALPNLAEKADK